MKIKNNGTGVIVIGQHKLIPGMNDVPGFEEHMQHPDIVAAQKERVKGGDNAGMMRLEVADKGAYQEPGHNDGTLPPPGGSPSAPEDKAAALEAAKKREEEEAKAAAEAAAKKKK